MANDDDFDFEAAARMSGLSPLGGDGDSHSEDEAEDHARKAQDAYRANWNESRVFVGPDGQARRADYSYPEERPAPNREGVEEAMTVPEDPNESDEIEKHEAPNDERTDDAVMESYRESVEQWNKGFSVASDAYTVHELQERRNADMREIMERGLAQRPELDNLEAYMSADIAWITRGDPRDVGYSDYMARRNKARFDLFSKGETASGQPEVLLDKIDDVETYARATSSLSHKMVKGDRIAEQYEFLSVRQEAVLEHFNNPRFIAEVGLYSANKIDDELLVDFDRWDLRDEKSQKRSEVLADTFASKVTGRPVAQATQPVAGETKDQKAAREARGTNAKVQSFQELREVGRAINHNQDAIIRFARQSQPGEGPEGKTDPKIGQDSLEIGLQALDDKKYSDSVMEEWLGSIPMSERKQVKNEPVALFRKARETFERDYDAFSNGKKGSNKSSLAASFAVMERSAEEILRNYPKYNRKGDLNNPADLGALALFSDSYREKYLDKVPGKVDAEVIKVLGSKDNGLLHDGTKSGVASHKSKGKGAEEYHLDLDKSGNDVHIAVADGNHLRLSNSKADAEAGKFVQLRLEGLATPALGVQTKNGKRDAGEAARGHLEEFVATYGTGQSLEHFGLEIVENKHGEKVLKATLPSSESLSQRMIRDGYGVPSNESEGIIRREELAKQAEDAHRGLWADKFPEVDRDWRSESRSPSLRARDKRERLADMVGLSMAANPKDVGSKLSHRETKIFSLPLKKWSANPIVDGEVDKIARTNPGRLMDIYDNNLEILKDLRKRKDKLSIDEKTAHDRLDMGRRAIGKSLVEFGHLDAEKMVKDGHPMMSREGRKVNLDALRPVGSLAKSAADKANHVVTEAAQKAPRFLGNIIDTAAEISH